MKKFKMNGTYRLKKKYISNFQWTTAMQRHFGKFSGIIEFTVGCLDAYGNAYLNDRMEFCVAQTDERHMFKRIDNK